MNITKAAIEKNRITGALLFVVLVGGITSYLRMPRAEDPGFTIRTAVVTTYFPGASPERVELLVTDKLEKTIRELPELDFVTSQSVTGVSLVFAEIQERYDDMRPIWDKLRRKVEKATPDLPEGVIGPIVNDEFGDVFGTIIAITGEGYSYAELKIVADEVRDELLRIDEVAKVDIHGSQEERIFVEYNNAGLAEIGLSPFQLQSILESRNIIIPGGAVTTRSERITLEPSGNFESVEDLERSIITLPGRDDVVYLEDIATVRRGYVDPPRTKARSSGVPALAIAISMREGGNIIELGKQFMPIYERLRDSYPIGIEFDIITYHPDVVDKKINDFIKSLLQAIVVIVLVMMATLGLRTGVVVSTLIPTTLLATFLVMSFFDIGLHQMSIAALIISLGMLVDNAIVMSESIMVRLAKGMDRLQAAVESAMELRLPLLTASLTTAAAFLPNYLAESAAGEYTGSIFLVVTITLLCSWLLSITMIPMLCHRFMPAKQRRSGTSYDTKWYRRYRGLLLSLLRHRPLTLAGTFGIFMLAMVGFGFVPNIFFPPSDRPLITAEMELPVGTSIGRTEDVAIELERFIRDSLMVNGDRTDGVTNWATFVGEGAPQYSLVYARELDRPEYAFMLINLSRFELLHSTIERLEQFAFDNLPDAITKFASPPLGPPVKAPIEVRISGRDPYVMFSIVDQVKGKLASIPGTRNIDDDWGRRTKKLLVNINESRARRTGVSSRDIAVSLQTAFSGFETTQYREGDKVIPVMMRSVAADRNDLGKIESLNIYAQATGLTVPLKQVADVEVVWQPSKILRRDRLKTVTVQADVAGVTAFAVNAQLVPWLEEQSRAWELGYRYEIGGEAEESRQSQASIMVKMPIMALIIVLLLVGQFNSLRRPLIILCTIPLGLVGVVFGLLVARSYYGFMTMLGVFALAGIVINNAIVLLDRIRIEIDEHGLEPARAVIEAAQRRLRPILLTTATTVGGLLPLWWGGGPMWATMAIAIIFGLLFATALTLGLVPVLYSLFFGVSFKAFRW
jgi:multidrug efflux pump subunit AcrB